MTILRSQSTNHTSESHTVFLHRYHVIRITKYRYKKLEGALRERLRTIIRRVMCAKSCTSRSYPVPCLENMSICSWKSRRIFPSATSCGASRGGVASGTDGVPGLAQALLGSGLLLHQKRQHHGRCHTSVSSGARTYRRQPVVIQSCET